MACNFGNDPDQEVKDCKDEDEKRENIGKIRDCEKVVLDCLMDRSKMQFTENVWAKKDKEIEVEVCENQDEGEGIEGE